jgi:hypothetical protein
MMKKANLSLQLLILSSIVRVLHVKRTVTVDQTENDPFHSQQRRQTVAQRNGRNVLQNLHHGQLHGFGDFAFQLETKKKRKSAK